MASTSYMTQWRVIALQALAAGRSVTAVQFMYQNQLTPTLSGPGTASDIKALFEDLESVSWASAQLTHTPGTKWQVRLRFDVSQNAAVEPLRAILTLDDGSTALVTSSVQSAGGIHTNQVQKLSCSLDPLADTPFRLNVSSYTGSAWTGLISPGASLVDLQTAINAISYVRSACTVLRVPAH